MSADFVEACFNTDQRLRQLPASRKAMPPASRCWSMSRPGSKASSGRLRGGAAEFPADGISTSPAEIVRCARRTAKSRCLRPMPPSATGTAPWRRNEKGALACVWAFARSTAFARKMPAPSREGAAMASRALCRFRPPHRSLKRALVTWRKPTPFAVSWFRPPRRACGRCAACPMTTRLPLVRDLAPRRSWARNTSRRCPCHAAQRTCCWPIIRPHACR